MKNRFLGTIEKTHFENVGTYTCFVTRVSILFRRRKENPLKINKKSYDNYILLVKLIND